MRRILSLIALMLPLTSAVADDNPDAVFYRKAIQGGLAEIDGGLLAQKQSQNPAIKSFGEMVVKDHTGANAKLRGLALANQVDVPQTVAPDQAAKRAALSALSGDAFDRAYIEWQILSHKATIAFFKEESASGDDIDAKQFATDTLPTLQAHLKILEALPTPPPAVPPATPPST